MPDPLTLRIGDRVRFVAPPDEWTQLGYKIPPESRQFMLHLITRGRPLRVFVIDESGYPWIEARIRRRGKLEYHSWLITESTGWVQVQPRNLKR